MVRINLTRCDAESDESGIGFGVYKLDRKKIHVSLRGNDVFVSLPGGGEESLDSFLMAAYRPFFTSPIPVKYQVPVSVCTAHYFDGCICVFGWLVMKHATSCLCVFVQRDISWHGWLVTRCFVQSCAWHCMPSRAIACHCVPSHAFASEHTFVRCYSAILFFHS